MRTWMREALNSSIATRGVRYKPLSPAADEVAGHKATGIRSRIPGGSPPAPGGATHLDSDDDGDSKGSDDASSARSARRVDAGKGRGGGSAGLAALAADVGGGGGGSGVGAGSGSSGAGVGAGGRPPAQRRDAKSHGPLCAYQNVCPGPDMIRTPALYLSYTCDTSLL